MQRPMRRFFSNLILPSVGLLLVPGRALAAQSLDTGDTAWVLVATALVLFMTIPGLALFYGGLVRTKNVLSVLMQCLALTSLITFVWLLFGYSLAFDVTGMRAGGGGLHAFLGGWSRVFLAGVDRHTLHGTIPEALFFAFQLTFAIITPALVVGSFAERMKFSATLWFSVLWLIGVYLPICHMTWGGDGSFFGDMGVLDFAGGIVVHTTAGVAALAACIVVGPRHGYPHERITPHNLTMTVTGTAMLWVGWFGFNAGSALRAGGDAAMALVATHVAASTATLTWIAIEWIRHGKPSVLGAATGSIAGLAAITPASGFVGPVGAVAIGLAAGVACWSAVTAVKRRFGYDDSLDVFGVHGVGGFLGTVLAGIFAAGALGGNQVGMSIGRQLGVQLFAALLTASYTLIASYAILKVVDAVIGLRVEQADEISGLDLTLHDETGYDL
jgi:Amt family ammonium transporter